MAVRRLRGDARRLWRGEARLVTGLRFLLFCCTALWVPVLLLPGDTTAGSVTYTTIRAVAGWLGLRPVDGILSPGELLLAWVAATLVAFACLDYAFWHGKRAGARVYLASMFWIGLATSYLIAAPRAYGTWLFVGFAALSVWCLWSVRSGEGRGGG